jgi:Protein of unknown function (DUF3096)
MGRAVLSSIAIRFPEQLGQPRGVAGDPPRSVLRQDSGRGINRSLSMRCHDPPDRARKSQQTAQVAAGERVVNPRKPQMMRTVAHLLPFAALGGGILILVKPPLLNYVVAVYLILVGAIGLNNMYHFIR